MQTTFNEFKIVGSSAEECDNWGKDGDEFKKRVHCIVRAQERSNCIDSVNKGRKDYDFYAIFNSSSWKVRFERISELVSEEIIFLANQLISLLVQYHPFNWAIMMSHMIAWSCKEVVKNYEIIFSIVTQVFHQQLPVLSQNERNSFWYLIDHQWHQFRLKYWRCWSNHSWIFMYCWLCHRYRNCLCPRDVPRDGTAHDRIDTVVSIDGDPRLSDGT